MRPEPILISHRGNLSGNCPERENHPVYIEEAINLGFDVECDVWVQNGRFFLGHDRPLYHISMDWLSTKPLWCHAKNQEALIGLTSIGLHTFWHEKDRFTLTSKGFIWCYPGNPVKGGILVVKSNQYSMNQILEDDLLGVCSDFISIYKK